jgi:DNA replication protein DnaC
MHERPTILIANYSRNEFAESLSPAILDRIRENGCGLYFDWESYRNAKCYAK